MNNLNFQLTVDEANLIIESLGSQPYTRVHALITKMHIQASEQIEAQQNGKAPAKQEENGVAAK